MIKLFVAFAIFMVNCSTPQVQQTQPVTAILGAFGEELDLLLDDMHQKNKVSIQEITFTSGLLQGKPVVIAQTGVGKVNAAMVTTLLLEHFKPTAVLFTGIAGAINENLQPGDLVIGTRVAHHDYGMLTDTLKIWSTQNPLTKKENPLYFTCDKRLVTLAQEQIKKIPFEKIHRQQGDQLPSVLAGTVVTGDVFVASAMTAQRLRTQLMADATEMEGAAVAQVCWQMRTPFIVIRSISDNADDKAHTDARAFYKVAARNSASLVRSMVASF